MLAHTIFSKHRLIRAGAHLALSIGVASAVAAIMFIVWYPQPFRSLSGGFQLFFIVLGVDVMLGPFATLVVSGPGKSAREWKMDMLLIVLMQLAAFGYGMWTVYEARPAYLAFEVDRFRTIHAVDVPPELLGKAPAALQALPRMGPRLIAVRPFRSEQERIDATIAALGGVFLGARPDLWMPYDGATSTVLGRAKPIEDLVATAPNSSSLVQEALREKGITESEVRYIPLAGRQEFWTVLIDAKTAIPLAYIPIDPYGP